MELAVSDLKVTTEEVSILFLRFKALRDLIVGFALCGRWRQPVALVATLATALAGLLRVVDSAFCADAILAISLLHSLLWITLRSLQPRFLCWAATLTPAIRWLQ